MQENPKMKIFDVTHGPMIKKYITYAVPLILISALQQSFNTADSIIIGKCASAEAFGGISATSSLFAILMSLFSGLALGVSVTVSQAIGEKDYKKAGEYARTSVLVAIVGGFILAAVTIPLSRPLFLLMNTPKENLEYAVNYMRILASGAPIILLYNYGGAILRALGDTKKPLIFLAISGCVNVLLSLTEVIRTCLKDRIFGTFWFVVLERRQPSVVLRTKIYSKIQPLRSENFKREDF